MNRPRPTIQDMDTYMYQAFDKYSNGNLGGGVEKESMTEGIADLLSREGDANTKEIAKRVKKTFLKQAERQRMINLNQEIQMSNALVSLAKHALDQFMNHNYANEVRWLGVEKADAKKREYTLKYETAKADQAKHQPKYDAELLKIKNHIPTRTIQYEEAKTPKDPNERNPVKEMNDVITEVKNAYPEYGLESAGMIQQVHALHENYRIDVSYSSVVNELITDLNQKVGPQVEKELQLKQKKMEIQDYYTKSYDKQIQIFKIIVFFTLFALVGGICLHYRLISSSIFALYLGLVLSIGFIVLFYALWDFFLRDSTEFDEYNFLVYQSPASVPDLSLSSNLNFDFKDNIIYC
jgi:hypothetical protein